ncbi:MAG: type II toxin-antitoxin system prevent-host-death family antitoxin [Candidatus Binatia bacterium]
MDVGVRELKQNLSAYLERAARGESIRVTDRGVPKAILGPVPGAARLRRAHARCGRRTRSPSPRHQRAPEALRRRSVPAVRRCRS